MPDRRAHRSAAPLDRELFAPEAVPRLAQATADRDLVLVGGVVASADRAVLEGCRQSANLAREVMRARAPGAWCVDLSRAPPDSAFEE